MKRSTAYICRAALVAALYVVLTGLSAALGLSSGVIQFRLSEVLCVLPVFIPAAIPGLAVGCLISNLLTGAVIWDVIFGPLATLLGALGTYALRRYKYTAAIPPVVANTLIIPIVLRYAYGAPEAITFMMLTVGVGEVVCCGVLGTALVALVSPRASKIFGERKYFI